MLSKKLLEEEEKDRNNKLEERLKKIEEKLNK